MKDFVKLINAYIFYKSSTLLVLYSTQIFAWAPLERNINRINVE
jgi:hypothetical protein